MTFKIPEYLNFATLSYFAFQFENSFLQNEIVLPGAKPAKNTKGIFRAFFAAGGGKKAWL
jgi:hypothetical protein